MIARKSFLFHLDHFSPAVPRIRSWMPVVDTSSRTFIAEHFMNGAHRG